MVTTLFKTIFEKSQTGMVLLGKQSEIIFANKAFCRMAGFDSRQVQAIHFSQLISHDRKEAFNKMLQRLTENEDEHIVETFRKLDTELELYWQIDAHLQYDESLGKRFIFCIVSDVTEQKKGHEQLKTAKDAAEKSTRDKSDFLANMSHEIRTPIHTIIGMNELLSETLLDPEQAEYAEQIRFSAEVLLSLINDILDFSKIEAGKMDLEKIDFDLYQMTEDALDMVCLEAHKKNLEVVLDIHDGVPKTVIGDPVRLRQIIVNLFNNAIKFTKEGEITTSIELLEQRGGTAVLKFTVKDSGIGIPKEKLGKLFKAFSQVDGSTTRKFGGTGLGLSISQNLSRMMNGKIGVESEFGEGSAFWFTAELGIDGGEGPGSMPVEEDLQGTKVLVVDNHPTAREVLFRYLHEWGYRAFMAEDGQEALALLREHADAGDPIRACLVDLLMPKMDGWQLASEINADKQINSTKLILLSPAGKSGEEAKMKLLHWFDAYMTKPVKKLKLYSNLLKILKDEVDLESVEDVEELEELPEEAAGSAGVPASILIAEDHEVNQQLFKAILESLNHEVTVASNGLEAVERASEKNFDIIFMDVQMPEMNGYEATEQLRGKGITTPIIAATASAVKEEREKCTAVGMDDLLIKPFKKADVVPILQKWLSKGGPPAAAAEVTGPADAAEEEPAAAAAETAEDPQIFDYQQAVETFMGKKDVVARVVKSFLEKVEGQVPVMKKALDSGDLEQLRGEAHSIKGGGLNLQVLKLGNKAKELEDASREGRQKDAESIFSELLELFDEFRNYINRFFPSL